MTVLSHDANFSEIPIPLPGALASTSDYRSIAVNLSAEEAAEGLVELSAVGVAAESYYGRSDGLNPPYYRSITSASPIPSCRSTVARKLVEVNRRLTGRGVELLVWDGYRSIECQQEIWDYFMEYARLATPHASDDQLFAEVSRYCSDPGGFDLHDSTTWPTHTTGGAVDLTLARVGRGELFMGNTFDDPSPISHTAYFETLHQAAMTSSDLDARRNRRLLYWSMRALGFTNYPAEWWHYDWGTQMWALYSSPVRPGIAVYGPAHLSSAAHSGSAREMSRPPLPLAPQSNYTTRDDAPPLEVGEDG